MSQRKDLYKIFIDETSYFLVFHKSLSISSGPSVSLYINNYEFLKFDCFGEKGHYHIYDKKILKPIYFTETTRKEQIYRVYHELNYNLQYYLLQSSRNDIRNYKIDIFNEEVIYKMLEYNNYYE